MLDQVTHRQRDIKRVNIVLLICEDKDCPEKFPDMWPLGLGSTAAGQAYWRGCPEGSDLPRCHTVMEKVTKGTPSSFPGAPLVACHGISFYYWVRNR